MIKNLYQKYKGTIKQFSRFVVIGFMNTGIDFAILNLLMWWTGIYSGKGIILINIVSFLVAVTNSYFWNKLWVFKANKVKLDDRIKVINQFLRFAIVTLIGLAINTSIIFIITTFIPPFFGLSKEIWANLAKAGATSISLLWNFTGYKFIIFKK
ncbi:MAG: GtrA family protein [bacterium]